MHDKCFEASVAGSALYFPLPQMVHSGDFFLLVYVPARQMRQDVADVFEYFPARQSVHADVSDPVAAFVNILPASHAVQEIEDSPEYFPSSQSIHADDIALAVEFTSFLPAGQLAQIADAELL